MLWRWGVALIRCAIAVAKTAKRGNRVFNAGMNSGSGSDKTVVLVQLILFSVNNLKHLSSRIRRTLKVLTRLQPSRKCQAINLVAEKGVQTASVSTTRALIENFILCYFAPQLTVECYNARSVKRSAMLNFVRGKRKASQGYTRLVMPSER
jgi:hypothetical protein